MSVGWLCVVGMSVGLSKLWDNYMARETGVSAKAKLCCRVFLL